MSLCFSDNEDVGTTAKEESPDVVMRAPKAKKRRKDQDLPAQTKKAKTAKTKTKAKPKKANKPAKKKGGIQDLTHEHLMQTLHKLRENN